MVATMVQPVWLDKVVNSYKDDSYTSQLIQKLTIDPQCEPLFSLSKGVLRYQGRIWIGPDKELQHTIISAFHDSPVGGHSGFPVTYRKLMSLFKWLGMKSLCSSGLE